MKSYRTIKRSPTDIFLDGLFKFAQIIALIAFFIVLLAGTEDLKTLIMSLLEGSF